MRFPLIGLLLTTSALAQPASQPATAPTPAELRAEYEKDLIPLPKLKLPTIADLVQVQQNRGLLQVRINSRVNADCQVICQDSDALIRAAGTRNLPVDADLLFSLRVWEFPKTLEGVRQIQIESGVRLVIAEDIETPTVSTSVQYIQDSLATDPVGTAPVLLYITGSDPKQDLRLNARNFSELQADHPAEVERYLRPILATLGQDSGLFAPSLAEARQVLVPAVEPSPEVLNRVISLLKKLDSSEFRERETAAEDLAEIGIAAARIIRSTDLSKLSEQGRNSASRFASDWLPLSQAEAESRSRSKDFILDCILLEDPSLRSLAIERLNKLTGDSIQLREDATASDRSRFVADLRRKLIAPATQPAR